MNNGLSKLDPDNHTFTVCSARINWLKVNNFPFKRSGKKSPTKTSNLSKHSVFSSKKTTDEHKKFISPQKWTNIRQNEDSVTRVSPRKQSPPKTVTSKALRKQTTPERTLPSILKQPSDKRISPYSARSTKNIVWDKSVIDALVRSPLCL